MMGTFLCLLSLAVIAGQAESPRTPDEIYMECGVEKAMNCTRPIREERITTSVRPEVECRDVIESKMCVEKICGPMPELVIKQIETALNEKKIKCDIRGSGGNNSTGTGSVAVIAKQAQSAKTPEEIYMECGSGKAASCSRTIEENGITVKPEDQCRDVIESIMCVEKICGPMPESVIKQFETALNEKKIKCDIRGSGGNNSTGMVLDCNNSTITGSVAVIAKQAQSAKTPEEIYMECARTKVKNCSMTIEENGKTVKPEDQCRNVIESKMCVEKICGPMPESVIKLFETALNEKKIKCDIRG